MCGGRKSSKTHSCAQSVCYFMSTAPTICVTTAAVAAQVREVMWAKIGKIFSTARRELPGRMGVTSWHVENEWRAIGISTDQPGNIQGFHAGVDVPAELDVEEGRIWIDPVLAEEDARRDERDPDEVIEEEVHRAKHSGSRLLFVTDEMAEIRPAILDTLQGSFMGDRVYVLAPFNPTFDPESSHPAAKTLEEGSGYHRIHISSEPIPEDEHPEGKFDQCFHGVPEAFVPKSWIEQQEKTWQRGTALFDCHVRGLPASVERERQFIPYRMLKAQFDRVLKDDGRVSSRHIGWDVAGSENGDWNVARLWVSGMAVDHDRWKSADTAQSRERVMMLAHKWGIGKQPIPWRNVHIDATGGSMGKAIADEMRARGCRIDAVDFGGAPVNDWERLVGPTMYFVNRKAELLWVYRRALETGLAALPRRFEDSIRQAQWYTYKEVVRSQGMALQCAEDKTKIKELFGRSPDDLEADMLAWSRGGQALTISKPMTPGQIGRRLAR
jgi:hypothetical protein